MKSEAKSGKSMENHDFFYFLQLQVYQDLLHCSSMFNMFLDVCKNLIDYI